jgi:anaerobic selenocysteine-containing dehydrogenase
MPWQLAADGARWSQNWSWRPSPERGEITKVSSVCTMCEGGCAIQARLVNKNRAILVEGNPASPLTEGGVCALAAAGLQFFYAPYRIAKPMKQQKSRGDISGFQPISWDEALSELGKKLGKLRADGKSQQLAAIISSRPSSMDDLWQQFFTAYGSSNVFRMPCATDGLTLAAKLTTGNALPFAFSLANADYVLSFGANLFGGAGSSTLAVASMRQWTKGATKLVQVESRCSLAASKADQFLAVNPGKEALLAMGIANVMVTSGAYDADYVKNNVFGFEDWTDSAGKNRQGFKRLVSSSAYSPEEVAKATGVDAAKIREVAKEFAGKPKALAVWALGQPDTTNGIYHQLAFAALNVLKGNLKPTGLITLSRPVPLAALPPAEKSAAADKQPQGGLYGLLDGISAGKQPVEMLLVHEANPLYSLPENKLLKDALAKVPTLVSFSSFMDETASQADLILPNHTAFERLDDVTGIPGAAFSYYAVSVPILKPLLDTKHTGEALMTLAAGIGGPVGAALPWKSYEDFLKFRVEGLVKSQKGALAEKPDVQLVKLAPGQSVQPNFSGETDLWKKLKAGSCWYDAPAAMPDFSTPSGKLELAIQSIVQKMAPDAADKYYLPHFEERTLPGNEAELPLLMVAYRPTFTSTGYYPIPPFITKLIPNSVLKNTDIFIELHPDTAAKLGVAQGDLVSLKTTQGEANVLVNITAAARPGVVYMPAGFGHKAYDKYIQGKGVNANSLMEVQLDPVGIGTVWACRAQLRRV